jgi:hypothetical protein
MFTAILTKHTANRGGLALPQLRYVTDRLDANYRKLRDYYQNSGGAADSRHILIRALLNLTGNYRTEPELYYDYVLNNYANACRAEQITTYTNTGAVHRNGHFYGRGSDEIYIAVESIGKPRDIFQNWRNQCPIKVVRHPYMDFNQNLPDGRGFIGGIAVFTIDFPMLGVMYQAWRLEEDAKPRGTQETVNQFIYQYVLPGILPSQANVAMLNRVFALANGFDTGLQVKSRHSIAVATPETYVNTIAGVYDDWALNGGRSFEQLLQAFPIAVPDKTITTAADIVVVDGIPRNRHTLWATTVAQIPLVGWLLLIDQTTNAQANTDEKVDIRRDLRIMAGERMFQGVRGGALDDIQNEITEQIQKRLTA